MFGNLLDIGLHNNLHVREERISSAADACRVLYVSDIHLRRGRSSLLAKQVVDSARGCAVDAVLLGGDLVDHSSELGSLRLLVEQLSDFAPVFAVGGNHDSRVGLDQVRDAVVAGGATWIHDCPAEIRHGSRIISVSGPNARGPEAADVRILCAHNPRIWKTARNIGYELVLAGHLHGCQVVAFEFRDRLYPGAIFYRYNYLSHQCGSTRLVVSRGVSDLVPVRWRCPREVVLCYV